MAGSGTELSGRSEPGVPDGKAPVEPLENTFSWSLSRERTFEECPRRYYLSYYGSWGGWDEDADPEPRRLWLLKQMQTRHMWIGDLVHRSCGFALTFTRHHGVLPPERELVRHFDHAMREEFRASRANLLLETGAKHTRLLEHDLDEPLRDGEWRTLHTRAIRALRTFVASPLIARVLAVPVARWLAIEDYGRFEVEGVPVSVRLDFAFDDGQSLTVVDWKTGARPSSATTTQLACYALYATETWHVPLERVRTLEVNLVRNESNERTISTEDADETRRRILASATKLTARLDDADANVASEEAFEKVETLSVCRRCVFQRACLGGRAVDVLGR